jgi:hypothetical protein
MKVTHEVEFKYNGRFLVLSLFESKPQPVESVVKEFIKWAKSEKKPLVDLTEITIAIDGTPVCGASDAQMLKKLLSMNK